MRAFQKLLIICLIAPYLMGSAIFNIGPATATTAGLVPTPPNNTTTFLRGDATFAQVAYANVTGTPAVDVTTGLPTAITFLSATSDVKTPTANNNWCAMTNAKITLTAGTWVIHGTIKFYGSGAVNYTIMDYVWASANGTDAGKPALLTVKAGFTDGGANDSENFGSGNMNTHFFTVQPVLKAVASNSDVYLIPLVNAGTVANSRIVTSIWAVLISTATS